MEADRHDGLEPLREKLERGFEIDAVDSTDNNLVITLKRRSELRQVRLDREAARALLEVDLDFVDAIPA